MDPEAAGKVATLAVADLIRGLLAAGGVNRDGLLFLRGQLDAETTAGRGWEPGPVLEAARFDLDEVLAEEYGCEPWELPGAEPIPDTPDEIPPPQDTPPENRRPY